MLKKTITFEDLEENEVTEDFYFSLSKADLIELELGTKGGFAERLQEIVDAEDNAQIIEYFKKIILMGYGKKAADGRGFIKTQELRDAFAATDAYSVLFVELATDAGAAAAFINGIVPKGMATEVQPENVEINAKPATLELPTAPPVLEKTVEGPKQEPAWVRENRSPTSKELTAMSREELVQAMAAKSLKDDATP